MKNKLINYFKQQIRGSFFLSFCYNLESKTKIDFFANSTILCLIAKTLSLRKKKFMKLSIFLYGPLIFLMFLNFIDYSLKNPTLYGLFLRIILILILILLFKMLFSDDINSLIANSWFKKRLED